MRSSRTRPAIVVDASAVVDLLVRAADSNSAAIVSRQDRLLAPSQIDVEVCGALKKLERRGRLTSPVASALVGSFRSMVTELVPNRKLMPLAWRLRHNCSMGDAFYVALASALAVPLLTRDRRLAAAASDEVEILLV